jgi:DNA-binding protein H-NS
VLASESVAADLDAGGPQVAADEHRSTVHSITKVMPTITPTKSCDAPAVVAVAGGAAKLGRFQGGKLGSKVARGFGARGAVAPKYRNPENSAETWAGRGLKPRWLAAAIKSGKKPEDFLIAGAVASKANGGKKTRKAKKSAKK